MNETSGRVGITAYCASWNPSAFRAYSRTMCMSDCNRRCLHPRSTSAQRNDGGGLNKEARFVRVSGIRARSEHREAITVSALGPWLLMCRYFPISSEQLPNCVELRMAGGPPIGIKVEL